MSSNDKSKSETVEEPASENETTEEPTQENKTTEEPAQENETTEEPASENENKDEPPSESETTEEPAPENDMSTEQLTQNKSPEPKTDPQPEATKNQDPEAGSTGSQQSLPQRLFSWTSHDLFDFNPEYAKSLRGILNILHIVFSMFVMSLVGSSCHTSDAVASGFYCRTSGTFTFVIACSAFIQSIIFCACCLLSKEGEKRMHATSYEVVYYVIYASLLFIASLVIVSSVSSRDSEGNYHTNLGAGVFGFFAAISYTCSAVWFFIYHKKYAKNMEDEDDETNQLQ